MRKWFVCILILGFAAGWGGLTHARTAGEYIEQADLAWSRDDLEGAEALFLEAVANATDGEPALRLGGFYLGQNRLAEAVERFQQAISAGLSAEPMRARAFVGMGVAYLHLGQSALARAALEEAVRIDPSREEQVRLLLDRLADPS
jgi:tetratricopeptide (TPR) repeat protein